MALSMSIEFWMIETMRPRTDDSVPSSSRRTLSHGTPGSILPVSRLRSSTTAPGIGLANRNSTSAPSIAATVAETGLQCCAMVHVPA